MQWQLKHAHLTESGIVISCDITLAYYTANPVAVFKQVPGRVP